MWGSKHLATPVRLRRLLGGPPEPPDDLNEPDGVPPDLSVKLENLLSERRLAWRDETRGESARSKRAASEQQARVGALGRVTWGGHALGALARALLQPHL